MSLLDPVVEPDAYIDDHGCVVIVGYNAWRRAGYVTDNKRAIPSSWIPLRRDRANDQAERLPDKTL